MILNLLETSGDIILFTVTRDSVGFPYNSSLETVQAVYVYFIIKTTHDVPLNIILVSLLFRVYDIKQKKLSLISFPSLSLFLTTFDVSFRTSLLTSELRLKT